MSERKTLITNIESSSVEPTTASVHNYGSISRNNSDDTEVIPEEMNDNRTTLNFLQKVGYSFGHVFNDLCAGIWFR
jgi:hypothetical protein